jgi:ABC-type multidrug transport system fused ATPase/permease subunit
MLQLFKLLYPYFRPYRRMFWAGFALMIIMNLMTYLIPQGIQRIFDQVLPKMTQPGGMALLAQWCGVLVLIALVRAAFLFMMIYCYWSVGTRLVNDLRRKLYDKLQRLPFSFYDTARTGDLMSRLTLDLEMVRNFYAFLIEHRSQIGMYLGIVTLLLLLTDWRLALACLAVTPLVVVTILRFSSRMRGAVDERQIQAGVLNATVQENITGIRVVKAFAMEEAETDKFRRENQQMRAKNLKVARLQAILHPFLVLCSSLGVAVILWYGGIRVSSGDLSFGTFVAFMSYLALLNWPLWMLAPNTNQIRQAQGSVKRLLNLLNQPETISGPADGGKILEKVAGRIEFHNVCFGYGEPAVLQGINLTVDVGETVAIIGLTGSGKTTLTNLIPRFYDPRQGSITVDGLDLRELNLGWWRRQVGLVLQETFLFSATIRDNIAFGRPEATQKEVEAAARAAQIHDFIMTLPDRYQTVVGERGVGLSGGQRQRVAIARALLVDPRILILDDSTSSVDLETEQAIQQSLQHLMDGRTTIIITQRLSTARLADRIIILESGGIRVQGFHEELVEQDAFYRHLYQIQSVSDPLPEESA